MRRHLMACLLLALPGAAAGDDKKDAPKDAPTEAKTTADILTGVEPLKGFGAVGTAEFRRRDEQTFVVWYNPYSGRAACYVYAYRFDAEKKQWVRFLDRKFEGTHDVSVEGGAAVTIRDVKGKVIYTEKAKD